MTRHLYKVGQRVHIMDEDAAGDVIVVGWAKILSRVPMNDFYVVKFEESGRIEARHIE